MTKEVSVFWFRRDLRLSDNAALFHALKSGTPVLPVFIFDTGILDKLPSKSDRRVHFIHEALKKIDQELRQMGSSLHVFTGKPYEVFKNLVSEFTVSGVYTNHDYEPQAIERDKEIKDFLETKNVLFHSYKDQCIFEKNEVLKDNGKPYTVFTPYSRKWKGKLSEFYYKPYPTDKYYHNFAKTVNGRIPELSEIGFEKTDINSILNFPAENLVRHYKENRDLPSKQGTSRLSVHLRFGTISIREVLRKTILLNETFVNELIWRDFYMMILFHFPHVEKNAFKKEYDTIEWRNNEEEFIKWCDGQTGFPIVDAGMRELNKTGFMHNRVRMIVSSFLVKDLLIDWRWGESYFADKLNDFDLSANNGGWQWAAGSGCDAAPYFRVFNPTEQQKKFDPDFSYIKKWVPEFGTNAYQQPIVDHAFARLRALKVYKEALSESKQQKLF